MRVIGFDSKRHITTIASITPIAPMNPITPIKKLTTTITTKKLKSFSLSVVSFPFFLYLWCEKCNYIYN